MKFTSSNALVSTSFLLTSFAQATIFLAPENDILLPPSSKSINPLTSLGANSPYFTGKFLEKILLWPMYYFNRSKFPTHLLNLDAKQY